MGSSLKKRGVRAGLKRVPLLHAAYKFAKQAGTVPLHEWSDLRRTASIARVLPRTMLNPRCLFNAYELVRAVNRDDCEGAIVECGVWRGGCVGLMGLAQRRFGKYPRELHLFDSFQGLPQPSERDDDVFEAFARGNPTMSTRRSDDVEDLAATGACVGDSCEGVEEFLVQRLGLAREDLVFHVGWFEQTVPKATDQIGPIAILRLDGDWYSSTKICIEHLYDLVTPGGYVIIDDFGFYKGCREAICEFMAARGLDEHCLIKVDGHAVYWQKSGKSAPTHAEPVPLPGVSPAAAALAAAASPVELGPAIAMQNGAIAATAPGPVPPAPR